MYCHCSFQPFLRKSQIVVIWYRKVPKPNRHQLLMQQKLYLLHQCQLLVKLLNPLLVSHQHMKWPYVHHISLIGWHVMFACCNTQFGTYKMFPVDLLYDSEEGSMSMEIGVEFKKGSYTRQQNPRTLCPTRIFSIKTFIFPGEHANVQTNWHVCACLCPHSNSCCVDCGSLTCT